MPNEYTKRLLEKNLTYATFTRRLVAMTIDMLVVSILLTPLLMSISYYIYGPYHPLVIIEGLSNSQGVITTEDLLAALDIKRALYRFFIMLLLNAIILGFFFIPLWHLTNATLGKAVTQCKILDAETLQSPSLKQYVMRYFGYLVSGIFSIGFIMILFTKRSQGLHDKIAGTIVVTHSKMALRKCLR